MNTLQKGKIGLTIAIHYFTVNGYNVLLPLNDSQAYDLAIEKDGEIKTVQCKTTWKCMKNNTDVYEASLRTIGGTKGTVYYCITDTKVDYLFCYRGDGIKYLIPVSEIKKHGYKNAIRLVTKKTPNCRLQTEKYIID